MLTPEEREGVKIALAMMAGYIVATLLMEVLTYVAIAAARMGDSGIGRHHHPSVSDPRRWQGGREYASDGATAVPATDARFGE